jgi:hypothetical protein
MRTAHRLSFPTCLSHPRSIHLHCQTVHRLLHLPCLRLQQQVRLEFSELCSSYETPSRRTHFHNTLSHLERISHRPDNLPLQPQPPLSPGESVSHRPDNLLLQLRSNTRRTTKRLSKEQMMTTIHTQPRNCMATTANNYDTHSTDKYEMLGLHRRRGSVHGFSLGSGCVTRGKNSEVDDGGLGFRLRMGE